MKKIIQVIILLLPAIFLSGCNTLQEKEEVAQKNTIVTKFVNSYPEVQATDTNNKNQKISEQVINAPQAEALNPQLSFSEQDNLWDILPHYFQFESVDNNSIERQVDVILKDPQHLYQISERAEPFLFFIFDEIRKRDLPAELALLPMVESAYQRYAYSSGRAAGLWQFIPSTGKYFGLIQNWWYDGRRDVYASTHAALDYLTALNKRFDGDWLLALAAYNAGAGTVNKAIRKNQKKSLPATFWDLKLPRETTAYVPKLLALKKIFKERLDNKQQQVALYPIANKPFLKHIELERQIDLTVAAEMAQMDLQELYEYNPAFNHWATNVKGPHHLLLPLDKAELFNNNIQNLDDSEWMRFKTYLIKSGDTLSTIARKFKLSTQSIKQANHLRTNKIRAGKTLFIPGGPSTDFEQYTKLARSHQKKIIKNKINIHTVRSGESLWSISRKYNTSYKQLARLNGLSYRSTLAIGQKLKILRSAVDTAFKRSPTTNKISYRVQKGDSLYRIAQKFNVSINQVAKWNDIEKKHFLKPGQKLTLYIDSGTNT